MQQPASGASPEDIALDKQVLRAQIRAASLTAATAQRQGKQTMRAATRKASTPSYPAPGKN